MLQSSRSLRLLFSLATATSRNLTALAQGARGDDPFGLRAEFVQLTRAAGESRSVNE